jgi:hypothetical protein
MSNLQLKHGLIIYDSENYIGQALALLLNITTLIMNLNIQLQFMRTNAAGSKAKTGVINNARICKVIAYFKIKIIFSTQLKGNKELEFQNFNNLVINVSKRLFVLIDKP